MKRSLKRETAVEMSLEAPSTRIFYPCGKVEDVRILRIPIKIRDKKCALVRIVRPAEKEAQVSYETAPANVMNTVCSATITREAKVPASPITVIRGHRGYSHGCVCGGASVTASNRVFRSGEFSRKYVRGDAKIELYCERDRSWKRYREDQHR